MIRTFGIEPHELVVDNFAGGGGASTGIVAALEGRPVDIAINHDPEAIAVHMANHPETRHYCESIYKVDPREACGGRPVGLAWFSPDCTHHSRARGGKPRSKHIRGLAWVVIRWAKTVAPRIIVLENVEEFETWGPLDDNGKPIAERAGETFRAWLSKLKSYGYAVEFKSLVAADYGTPTTRRRLFLIARRDGRPIVWPQETHGRGRGRTWRTAAEIIDWDIACPSIFERRRPLAEATLRRIAVGIRRYVLETGAPFIVPVTHPRDARVHGLDEPLRTVTAANRGELAVVAPAFVARTDMQSDGRLRGIRPLEEPLRTITTGGGHAVIAPTLSQTGYGEREGQAPRALDIGKPLGTVVAGGAKHALVAAFISKHYGGVVGHGASRPLGAITAKDHHAVTTAFLTKFYGTSVGADVRAPLPTVTSSGGRGGGHLAEVRVLLDRFAAETRRPAQGDLFAARAGDEDRVRNGILTIGGEDYAISDIGMRMLQPHELFAAQGFPPDYLIDPEFNGKPLPKGTQTALAGNSVCPQVARAIVAANVRENAEAAA
jgi:DNA (cytosine-5)-methyltransferase 1